MQEGEAEIAGRQAKHELRRAMHMTSIAPTVLENVRKSFVSRELAIKGPIFAGLASQK